MFQKSLLILAIAMAGASVQAQSTPAKKELVARILKVQQPGIENMARRLVENAATPMMEAAQVHLQRTVPAEKRETVAKEIDADARKYSQETTALVRDRALKLAPTTMGPMLEEKFSEDELKQLATMLESPVLAKFSAVSGEMQRALIEKVVADTRTQVEPRIKALEDTITKRLGLPANAAAPAARPSAPKK